MRIRNKTRYYVHDDSAPRCMFYFVKNRRWAHPNDRPVHWESQTYTSHKKCRTRVSAERERVAINSAGGKAVVNRHMFIKGEWYYKPI